MIRSRRVLTGLAVAGAVCAVVAADTAFDTRWGTAGLLVALAAVAIAEFYALLEVGGIRSHAGFGVLATVVLLGFRAAAPDLGLSAGEAREVFLAGLALAAVAPLAAATWMREPQGGPDADAIRRTCATAAGLVYVTLTLSFLLELRLLPGPGPAGADRGLVLCFLLVLAVKVGDSSAYFVGRAIGRLPLAWVSPKKTVEGALASVTGAVAVCAAAALVLGLDLRAMVGFGLVADLAGQSGDLVESYVKRCLGAKDSAATFGEMGGVLDMVDGLLLAAPAAYVWARLVVPA